ncbi:MAG: P1 family peptidase [Prevotellaceae bacterium]|jgi:D-aminopeptidase|nr:P1 family peptidase [Prevotellaceae bacterium]
MTKIIFSVCIAALSTSVFAQQRLRDYGIEYGIFKTGKNNAITDVAGVKVGHVTLIEGNDIRTGVTAIIPHEGNVFQQKCPAAIYAGNGFGKLTGYTQVCELGNIETPIILTNTLSVAQAVDGIVTYTITREGNENVKSVNSIVGETNDGGLNNIRKRYVTSQHVIDAITAAKAGAVAEGNVGAGTGTQCFGYKGGIGTSSRVLPAVYGNYTVGVLVQSNFGGILEINGVQAGKKLGQYSFKNAVEDDNYLNPDGSCMIVVITDAPVDARNLERMAKRAMLGLAKTGGIASNGSGDYVIALSVCKENLIDENTKYYTPVLLHNDAMSALFEAVIEATAEAIWNSLFTAKTMTGFNGKEVKALPVDEVVKMLKQDL